MYSPHHVDFYSAKMTFREIISDNQGNPFLVFKHADDVPHYRYAALSANMVSMLLEDKKLQTSDFAYLGYDMRDVTLQELAWLSDPQTPELHLDKVTTVFQRCLSRNTTSGVTVMFGELASALYDQGGHQLEHPRQNTWLDANLAQIKPEELQKGLDAWRKEYNLPTPHAG